jgi:hypothetical protein
VALGAELQMPFIVFFSKGRNWILAVDGHHIMLQYKLGIASLITLGKPWISESC